MSIKNTDLYFAKFTDEIELRIKQHTVFILCKILVCGIFIYFSIAMPQLKIFNLLIAVCFDCMIFHNIRLLNRCGKYIGKLEKELFGEFEYESIVQKNKTSFWLDQIDRIGWLGITIIILMSIIGIF